MRDYSDRDYFQAAFGLSPEDFYLAVPADFPWEDILKVAKLITGVKLAKAKERIVIQNDTR